MDIVEVDPHDELALRRWWEAAAASSAERPYDPYAPWELLRAAYSHPDPEGRTLAFAAMVEGDVVGTAEIRLPEVANSHLAQAEIQVLPDRRRQGVGSRLIAAVEQTARAAGRRTLIVEAAALPGSSDDAGGAFLQAHGFEVANTEDRKILDLAIFAERSGTLEAHVAARIGDYVVVTWRGSAPEPYVDGYCELLSRFLALVPLGDLDLVSQDWTPDRLRANERRARELGREVYVAAAVAPDGSLCGASDLRLTVVAPTRAGVGITLVLPEHRGHALGLALKLATHAELRAARPECRHVSTGNAGVNDHMNAINDLMGYRVVETLSDYQREPDVTGGRVVTVDPFDRKAFDGWYAAYLAADTAGRGRYASPWTREEYRTQMQSESVGRWTAAYAVVADGTVVAAASLELPLLDNREVAQVEVHTHPDHRRRGHGTLLLRHVEAVARERGRTTLMTEASYPYDGPATADDARPGAGSPGPAFAYARGFTLGLADVQRVLDLPVDADLLSRLAAEAAVHHPAYTLRSFAGRVPDELAQGYAEADAAVDTEAPTGDLDLEPQVASIEVLREHEAVLEAQQRTRYTTVALDAAGQVAAYSDLVVPALDPGVVYQWGTLVRRQDRGHRLGVAVKVANLAFLQREQPGLRDVRTYNAESNVHMVAINHLLGFRPVERLGEFQRRLG